MLVYLAKVQVHTTFRVFLGNVANILQVYPYMNKTMHLYPKCTTNEMFYWCYPGKPTSSLLPAHPTSIQPIDLLESYKVEKQEIYVICSV